MTVVILGCGAVGTLAAERLLAAGQAVLGVRRSPPAAPRVPLIAGDAADPALWQRLPAPSAVLLTATPGHRRGRDHRLAEAARLVPPGVRLVYSGTTAVYGDAAGAAVDEDGPLAAEAGPLLAIEAAVLAHGDALVLRCPALVGPQRRQLDERLRAAANAGVPLTVAGDPDRPFSFLHEADLAELLVSAIIGPLRALRGVYNAAHPRPITLREHYRAAAQRAGVELAIVGDGTARPRRAIAVERLLAALPPTWRWRGPADP
ncbi:MAG: NAD-dependent epimerase/dehydratase family protein [Planctomycetota bacterium]|nr:NAD-dependent epimerase/dehydratase family protein [Planctomycetota bacterium]MCX8040668.1 NAD-dependent epimerase/dehydratase family protein [Planctomycetota bacterium]